MSLPKTRRRIQTLGSGFGRRQTIRDGALISQSSAGVSVAATQTTVSEGHPFHHKFEGRDDGGDFLTKRWWIDTLDPRNGVCKFEDYYLKGGPSQTGTIDLYRGPVFPVDPATFNQRRNAVEDNASSDYTLITHGTTAIARCKPGQPVADLAVALAELYREGIPNLVGHATWAERGRALGIKKRANMSADEFLNWTFGWSPIISEVKSVAGFVTDTDKIMGQFERDSGRVVRRNYKFPDEISETTVLEQNNVNPHATHLGGLRASMFLNGDSAAQGSLYKTTTVVKKRWFSGAFTYYLPDGYYSRDRLRRAAVRAKVFLGLEITPEVIWNLTPWSWASDWFLNTGNVLSNVTDFASQDLVLHYGYIMEHTITTHRYQLKGHTLLGVPKVLEMSFHRETKRRIKATPFGFGLTWDGLSPKQLAIAAALGITRT